MNVFVLLWVSWSLVCVKENPRNNSSPPLQIEYDPQNNLVLQCYVPPNLVHQIGIPRSITAWKVSVSGVILVCIQPICGKMRTRITPNTDNFHAVHPPARRCAKEITVVQNLKEFTCTRVSFLIKLQVLGLQPYRNFGTIFLLLLFFCFWILKGKKRDYMTGISRWIFGNLTKNLQKNLQETVSLLLLFYFYKITWYKIYMSFYYTINIWLHLLKVARVF